MANLTYSNKQFFLHSKPINIISGAIHYFRVVPEYWEDRLRKLKACGFNTVETYCAWNLHEQYEGHYDFDGMLNLGKFLSIAHKLGLYAIVRPGPYICAEWDFGGFPYWLHKYPMRLRCSDKLYLSKVECYYEKLCEVIRPHLEVNGGNVIAMQIENEYGSFGNDKEYLKEIKNIYEKNDMDCLYFTSDGPTEYMLTNGTLDGVLATCNFGSRGNEARELFRRYRNDDPFMCMEFWNGWFDHWGEEHHTRSAEDVVQSMSEILDDNGNINFYMFHGGTNFGFTNGANHDGKILPTVTSYDYDSPLSECGDMTEKYFAVKEELEKRFGRQCELEVSNSVKYSYGKVELTEYASLDENLDNISAMVKSATPLNFEQMDIPFGFALYRTTVNADFIDEKLAIDGLNDRAIIFVDGVFRGVFDNHLAQFDEIRITTNKDCLTTVDILVENMGRVNFGKEIGESKGIHSVRLGAVHLFGWEMYPLTLTELSNLKYNSDLRDSKSPTFLRGSLNVDVLADTFVSLSGLTKGNVFINGFNLGRYWCEMSPKTPLYLPAPLLKKGENEIVVFESTEVRKNEEIAVFLTA